VPDFWKEGRKGDSLYRPIVALDSLTGALQCHYQAMPHDIHDWK